MAQGGKGGAVMGCELRKWHGVPVSKTTLTCPVTDGCLGVLCHHSPLTSKGEVTWFWSSKLWLRDVNRQPQRKEMLPSSALQAHLSAHGESLIISLEEFQHCFIQLYKLTSISLCLLFGKKKIGKHSCLITGSL